MKYEICVEWAEWNKNVDSDFLSDFQRLQWIFWYNNEMIVNVLLLYWIKFELKF